MANKKTGGVRIGPISLLTLVSVLLLAVLSVLCVTTTNAANAMSQRQAANATETYEVEACGQAMVAAIDEKITGADDPLDAITREIDNVRARALEIADASDLDLTASVDGSEVSFTVATDDGRTLDAVVVVDGSSYTIKSWKMTTTQQDSSASLWAGTDTAQ